VPGTITKPAPTGVSAHIRLPSQPQTYPQILRTGHFKEGGYIFHSGDPYRLWFAFRRASVGTEHLTMDL